MNNNDSQIFNVMCKTMMVICISFMGLGSMILGLMCVMKEFVK